MTEPFRPIADDLWGRPCLAIHVQPGFAPGAQERLHALQGQAAALWPGALHRAPAHAIHVTIYPLVPVPDGFDKEAHWRAVEAPIRAILAELCADAPALTLRFNRLKVTPVGLIAVAEEATGLVARIRARILSDLPPPPGREHVHYDLVHTTLARFASADPVPPEAVAAVESHPVAVNAPVDRIRLFRETLFPCIVGEELETYRLRDGR
ncbi:MAG TPA: 2'-5' RNA ligase family protein [Microvirga sp.]|jgi:2'-5' RNA ligase